MRSPPLARRPRVWDNAGMANSTSLTVSKQNNVTVITARSHSGSLDAESIPNLYEILELVQDADPPIVVFDLLHAAVTSSFLGFLVQVWHRLRLRDGWRFAVAGMAPSSVSAFKSTRFDQLWETFDSTDEAVRAMSANDE